MKKLEVYYLANKSENLYFTLLGDCSQSDKREEEFDKEVIEEGRKEVKRLNKKYKTAYRFSTLFIEKEFLMKVKILI